MTFILSVHFQTVVESMPRYTEVVLAVVAQHLTKALYDGFSTNLLLVCMIVSYNVLTIANSNVLTCMTSYKSCYRLGCRPKLAVIAFLITCCDHIV